MRVTILHIKQPYMSLALLVAVATLCMTVATSAWGFTGQDIKGLAQLSEQAPIFTFDYEDSGTKDAFRFWSPNYPQPIRGIVMLVPGANYDGRSMVTDDAWQAFAQEHRLALISCFISSSDPKDGSGDALERAIAAFAKQSSHPELPQTPLMMYGESAGGQFNYNFVFWKPTRVMAFIVNKGGYYNDEAPDPRVYAVPGLFFLGMNDSQDRIASISRIWSDGRSHGALWALAPQPNSGHEFSKTAPMARIFFAAVLNSRLPDSTTAVDYAHMKSMQESQGWIGNLTRQDIRPAIPDGKPALDSSWLPGEALAAAWHAFVSEPQVLAPNQLAFEAASIKKVDASRPIDPKHFFPQISQAHAAYPFMTVRNLVEYAYRVESFQVTGPDWTNADHFDIEATIREGANKEDAPWMLQALLKQRFKLAFHIEKKELERYVLVVSKHGGKLTPSLPDPPTPEPDSALKLGDGDAGKKPAKAKITNKPDGSSTVDLGKRGILTTRFDKEEWAFHFERSKITMEELAGIVKGCLGNSDQQVEDQTGIKGTYQIAYDCPMQTARPTKDSGATEMLPSDPQSGSVLTRSLDALGLNLEKRKILVNVYVIDHVESPSAN